MAPEDNRYEAYGEPPQQIAIIPAGENGISKFLKSPLGEKAIELGFDELKKAMGNKPKETAKKGILPKLLEALRENWIVFWLIPMSLGASLIILILFYKLAIRLLGV